MTDHEKILAQISELLDKAGLVMAADVDDDQPALSFTLRKRVEGEDKTKLEAYGRNVYTAGPGAFSPDEAKALQAWTARWEREQHDSFPRPEVRFMRRLDSVRILTRHSFYDGVLTGFCVYRDTLAHFAVFDDYETILRPRTFCVWNFDLEHERMATQQLSALADSHWAHLIYDLDGTHGAYRGPAGGPSEWPRKDLKGKLDERMQADRQWIDLVRGKNVKEALEYRSHPGAPDAWFTYADTNLDRARAQTREQELADRMQLAKDSLIESWDYDYPVEGPLTRKES